MLARVVLVVVVCDGGLNGVVVEREGDGTIFEVMGTGGEQRKE